MKMKEIGGTGGGGGLVPLGFIHETFTGEQSRFHNV